MKTSNERDDLRVRRTRKLLWDALMAELAERPFEEVTVRDLCERAMVHRTTFYKHYEDKYALLDQGVRQMYAELVEEGHAPPSTFSVDRPPPYFVRLFEHIAEHQAFYRAMLCGEGVSRFQRLVKDYVAEIAEARAHDMLPANLRLSVPPAMHVQFFAGGALSLITWWLEQNMPLSPFQMAQYLLAIHNSAAWHA